MFNVQFDTTQFEKEMTNIVQYSVGFLQGAEQGKTEFLKNMGSSISELLNNFIDSNARVDPAALHHVYEWDKTGSPTARLFDISYIITGGGLSVNSTFRQSLSVKNGSRTPFYDKANIMENGIPVTIKPRASQVLAFTDGDEEVFTRKPISIDNPGGDRVVGSYENTFRSFFDNYFTQSFLQSSGISKYFENPQIFNTNLRSAKTGGKALGTRTGYRWVSKAGIEAA